ncbi:MAG: hypothetical protein HWD59_05650 [Coxiellaceae bacterium]|nr:MAG: hypothetical protein HWD59_05650 [Coxiellaceae bacterium]
MAHPLTPLPEQPPSLHAHISSQRTDAQLNDEGHYWAQPVSAPPLPENAPAWPKLMPFGGPPTADDSATGLHAPLRDQAEVLIGFIHGDPSQSVVWASLPNPEQSSPVTAANPSQSQWTSHSQHRLAFDDSDDSATATLAMPTTESHLQLTHHADKPGLSLHAGQGWLQRQAEQNLFAQSQQHTSEQAGQSQIVQVGQNHQAQVQQNFTAQATQGQWQQAATQNLTLSSQAHSQFMAGQATDLTAAQQLSFQSNGQSVFQASQGQVQLSANQAIQLASQGGTITLGNTKAGLMATPEGDWILFGDSFQGYPPETHDLYGDVHQFSGGTMALKSAPTPSAIQPLPTLTPHITPLQPTRDLLVLQLRRDDSDTVPTDF